MKGTSRILVLALGIAIAILIAVAALHFQDGSKSSFSGTPGAPKTTLSPHPAAPLQKALEKIALRSFVR